MPLAQEPLPLIALTSLPLVNAKAAAHAALKRALVALVTA